MDGFSSDNSQSLPAFRPEQDSVFFSAEQKKEVQSAVLAFCMNPTYAMMRKSFPIFERSMKFYPTALFVAGTFAEECGHGVAKTLKQCISNPLLPEDLRDIAADFLYIHNAKSLFSVCTEMLALPREHAAYASRTLARFHKQSPANIRPPFGERLLNALEVALTSLRKKPGRNHHLEQNIFELLEKLGAYGRAAA